MQSIKEEVGNKSVNVQLPITSIVWTGKHIFIHKVYELEWRPDLCTCPDDLFLYEFDESYCECDDGWIDRTLYKVSTKTGRMLFAPMDGKLHNQILAFCKKLESDANINWSDMYTISNEGGYWVSDDKLYKATEQFYNDLRPYFDQYGRLRKAKL